MILPHTLGDKSALVRMKALRAFPQDDNYPGFTEAASSRAQGWIIGG